MEAVDGSGGWEVVAHGSGRSGEERSQKVEGQRWSVMLAMGVFVRSKPAALNLW